MRFFRQLSTALGRLSHRMQGQDVERGNVVPGNRLGADYAAVMRSRQTQGFSPIGFGR